MFALNICVPYSNTKDDNFKNVAMLIVYMIVIWVSQWLLFNANSEIVQLYHGENKLIFNEMMMRSTLY